MLEMADDVVYVDELSDYKVDGVSIGITMWLKCRSVMSTWSIIVVLWLPHGMEQKVAQVIVFGTPESQVKHCIH